MRTASGVEHAEGGGNPKNANKHGFQLWINLPSKLKMATPGYGTVQPEDIPEKHLRLGSKLGILQDGSRLHFWIEVMHLQLLMSKCLQTPSMWYTYQKICLKRFWSTHTVVRLGQSTKNMFPRHILQD